MQQKRDAWKKLEGISVLQARYMYVEALLRAAAEVIFNLIIFYAHNNTVIGIQKEYRKRRSTANNSCICNYEAFW